VTTPTTTQPERKMSALEKSLLGVSINQVPHLLPGLLAAVLLAWLRSNPLESGESYVICVC
jgi:hypothetical protein